MRYWRLMRWVEEGLAPDYIVATKFDNDTAPVVASQRPLCVYPKVAKYDGEWKRWRREQLELLREKGELGGLVGGVAS